MQILAYFCLENEKREIKVFTKINAAILIFCQFMPIFANSP